VPELIAPTEAVRALATAIRTERNALQNAAQAEERQKLVREKEELEDRKLLSASKSKLLFRREVLRLKSLFEKAFNDLQSRSITQRANELVDKYLTEAVVTQFEKERAYFDINHLKVVICRKSGQTKAEFEVSPQSKLTKVPSHVLSEGEQRALALACFLTEVALTDGTGPIIIDDPVSSLDRDRSAKVAERLAEESSRRQVIVFTHDIVFFNELCSAAERRDIEPVAIALFSDKDSAGKIDPAGMVWKGLNVAKRIGKIKNDLAPLKKIQNSSPSEYEYRIKNLYGRLRDTYERVVEEVIFKDIVRRGVDVVQTQLLRYVTLPDALAIRFHEGMALANTHSHDNPASDTVSVRTPEEFKADIDELEALIAAFKAAHSAAEAARPQMQVKK